MENSNAVRLARVVAGAAVWLRVVAAWPGGRVKRDRAQDQLHLQDLADNFFEQTYDPERPKPRPAEPVSARPPVTSQDRLGAPTEKSINPTGGNLFTPTVHAPPAPTAIPGNRENTG